MVTNRIVYERYIHSKLQTAKMIDQSIVTKDDIKGEYIKRIKIYPKWCTHYEALVSKEDSKANEEDLNLNM